MPNPDSGAEWYLLKDQADVDQFLGSPKALLPPKTLPAFGAYVYDSDGLATELYVYPADLRSMLGQMKNLAPAAFAALAQEVREIQG